jgi:putative membrane protein
MAGLQPPETSRFTPRPPASPAQILSFCAALVILLVSLNGPVHDLSDYYLFSAHMVQHLLLTLVAPPLLIAGTPGWMLRPLLSWPVVGSLLRWLTKPSHCFAIFNVVLAGWHLPPVYNLAMTYHAVHILQHLMFIAAAVLMWWPVVSPVPELTRLSAPLKMLYLFAFGIPMSVVAALITLTGEVLYPWYEAAPRVFDLSALDDQQLGGLIMWVPAMKIYWIAITILFFRWSRQDLKESAGEGVGRGAPEAAMVPAGGSRE